MTAASPPGASGHQAWWCWTLAQAAVLAAYAAGVKPTDGYPEPVELTADLGLACVQVIAAALLGWPLVADPGRVARTAAAGVVFAVVAGRLAATPGIETVRLIGLTATWAGALTLLSRDPIGRLTAVFLALIGPVLYYARLEYRPDAGKTWQDVVWPAVGICTTRLHSHGGIAFLPPVILIAIAAATHFGRKTGVPRKSDICNIPHP